MDTEGNIKEHSKEKLLLYKEYLRNYLAVLTKQPFYDNIIIWDVFAGSGKDDKGYEGSALIGANIIKEYNAKTEKEIFLIVNEKDANRYNKLETNLEAYKEFTTFYNKEAEVFLSEATDFIRRKYSKFHHLIFMDPHGYTQYSLKTLSDLLTLKSIDYLIFMPTTHIYRFINDQDGPAFHFLLGLGIEERRLPNIQDIVNFVKELQKQLKEKAKTKYCYNYEIKNKSANNSIFHLFFITKHYMGALKFLEAKNKIKKILERQLSLFNLDEGKLENQLLNFLKDDGKTNTEIFHKMLEIGFLSKETNPVLKRLEKENKIKIENLTEERIRKHTYYLTDQKDKIKISVI